MSMSLLKREMTIECRLLWPDLALFYHTFPKKRHCIQNRAQKIKRARIIQEFFVAVFTKKMLIPTYVERQDI